MGVFACQRAVVSLGANAPITWGMCLVRSQRSTGLSDRHGDEERPVQGVRSAHSGSGQHVRSTGLGEAKKMVRCSARLVEAKWMCTATLLCHPPASFVITGELLACSLHPSVHSFHRSLSFEFSLCRLSLLSAFSHPIHSLSFFLRLELFSLLHRGILD